MHDVIVVDKRAALARLIAQLAHYRQAAPYHREVVRLVEAAFERTNSDRLVDLNVNGQIVVCDYLQVPFHWQLWSRSGIALVGIEHPGQWALRICETLGENEYVNAPGGVGLFQAEEWDRAGIRLEFLAVSALRYSCAPYAFEPSLSILDALMWLHPEQIKTQWQFGRRQKQPDS
jgi:hypothetical protein